ncbi:cupin domain-containing protein [Streptomyces sp. NPDC047917]|uniref:cupin domain-containing protein n=1 Tax=Streptomyces sp. NPDC047917 TaxID=3365491 RepID=UPI00371412F5
MAVSAGEVYYNPPCRQKIVVRTAAADTGGARSVLDLYVAPGGFAADYHLHPASEERFTLVRGRLRVSMADRDVILDETGQTVASRRARRTASTARATTKRPWRSSSSPTGRNGSRSCCSASSSAWRRRAGATTRGSRT